MPRIKTLVKGVNIFLIIESHPIGQLIFRRDLFFNIISLSCKLVNPEGVIIEKPV